MMQLYNNNTYFIKEFRQLYTIVQKSGLSKILFNWKNIYFYLGHIQLINGNDIFVRY